MSGVVFSMKATGWILRVVSHDDVVSSDVSRHAEGGHYDVKMLPSLFYVFHRFKLSKVIC